MSPKAINIGDCFSPKNNPIFKNESHGRNPDLDIQLVVSNPSAVFDSHFLSTVIKHGWGTFIRARRHLSCTFDETPRSYNKLWQSETQPVCFTDGRRSFDENRRLSQQSPKYPTDWHRQRKHTPPFEPKFCLKYTERRASKHVHYSSDGLKQIARNSQEQYKDKRSKFHKRAQLGQP